jgi:hypothetical protein
VLEAIEKLHADAFDVVVSDEKMPDAFGRDLLAVVRERFPACRRILISGEDRRRHPVGTRSRSGVGALPAEAVRPREAAENHLRFVSPRARGPKTRASPLILLTCQLPVCQRRFLLCSQCYRGQRYCGPECSAAARVESVRRARRKYAQHEDVRAQRRENARAAYWAKKNALLTDQTSNVPPDATRVHFARGPAMSVGPSKRAKASNDPPRHASLPMAVPRSPRIAQARCSHCGRPATRVLFRTRRFQR